MEFFLKCQLCLFSIIPSLFFLLSLLLLNLWADAEVVIAGHHYSCPCQAPPLAFAVAGAATFVVPVPPAFTVTRYAGHRGHQRPLLLLVLPAIAVGYCLCRWALLLVVACTTQEIGNERDKEKKTKDNERRKKMLFLSNKIWNAITNVHFRSAPICKNGDSYSDLFGAFTE